MNYLSSDMLYLISLYSGIDFRLISNSCNAAYIEQLKRDVPPIYVNDKEGLRDILETGVLYDIRSCVRSLSFTTGEGESCIEEDTFSIITQFTNITQIYFMYTEGITDEILLHISKLHKLEVLSFHCCSSSITLEGIKYISRLRNLRELKLGISSQIANKGCEYISKLNNLESLIFSPWDYDYNLSGLINLEELYLDYCFVSNESLKYISELPNLRRLRLFDVDLDTDYDHIRLLLNTPIERFSIEGVQSYKNREEFEKCIANIENLI